MSFLLTTVKPACYSTAIGFPSMDQLLAQISYVCRWQEIPVQAVAKFVMSLNYLHSLGKFLDVPLANSILLGALVV